MIEMDNILSIKKDLCVRFKKVRKDANLSQSVLAERSGISLGSLKRFERTGDISIISLLKLAMALGYEEDFNTLFVRKNYQSIYDVIKDAK